MKHALLLAIFLFSSPFLVAQGEQVITAARVKETVSWLASDERLGRDTPSPGLEAAAD